MRTLVVGGGASGKSAFAESLAMVHGGRLVYIATMRPSGREAQVRIDRHHALRAGKGFRTVECYTNLAEAPVDCKETVLLEDLGNLVANELFCQGATPEGAYGILCRELEALQARCAHLVVVSNDIFRDGGTYPAETEAYIRLLGAVNVWAAEQFDRVLEVVSGMAMWHKGGET